MELPDFIAWRIFLEWKEKEGITLWELSDEEIISLIKYVGKEVKMAIMTCPKCGGCGSIVQGDVGTTGGQYNTTCPSCQGRGYVTDEAPPIVKDLGAKLGVSYISCPHCSGMLKIVPEFWQFGNP